MLEWPSSTRQAISAGKVMEKREPSFNAGKNV